MPLAPTPAVTGSDGASCCSFLPAPPPKLSLTRFPWEDAAADVWASASSARRTPHRPHPAAPPVPAALPSRPPRNRNFVSSPRSTFLITFSTTLSRFSQWLNGQFRSLSKGQGRGKAGLTSVHGHSPYAAHCPPRISVPLESCSLGNGCRHWYQDKLSWELVHGVCPPSASPGPSPWMLSAKPPRPPLRHSVLAGIPGQSTHTRGSDRSRRFL